VIPIRSTLHGGQTTASNRSDGSVQMWRTTRAFALPAATSGAARVKFASPRSRARTETRHGPAGTSSTVESPTAAAPANRVNLHLGLATLVGLVGYVGMVVTGTRLGPLPNPPSGVWWFSLPAGHLGLLRILFYLSTAVAIAGWVGVGRVAWRGRLTVKSAVGVLCVWSLPLLLGPPLMSKDIYSYIGQGLIAHRGLNPYTVPPAALGNGPLLRSIASVWRHSPAPYGPLFVAMARGITSIMGTSIVPEVIVMRAMEIAGMVLIAVFVPRLAKRLGADPGIALWLGALSPLVLLSFMASGHNDCLMVGLVVAGVTLSLDGRRSLGLILCALAALIKAPAAAAIVFLAVDELRAAGFGRRSLGVLAKAVALPVATVVAVTLASGLGWRWIEPGNLRIPTELRILATPTVSLGVVIDRLLAIVRIHVSQHGTITVVQTLGGVLALAGALWLVTRFRHDNLPRVLAVVLLLVVLAGPTVWPWYLTWGLILLAATGSQTSKVLAVTAALAVLMVGPVGTPELSGYLYWPVSLVTVAGCVWLLSGRRWETVVLGQRPRA
jgi:alpha-1,6-mannosyltransferase